MPIEWISAPWTNLPFDSATRYLVGSKERLACSATLEHYIKISSVQELPPETSSSLLSTCLPVPKKGTDRCADASIPANPTSASGTSTLRWRAYTRSSSSFAATTTSPRWISATSTCTSSSAKLTARTCGSRGRARSFSASACHSA